MGSKLEKYFISYSMWSSEDQTWRTPKVVYDSLNTEFHFDFDPCPSNPTFDGLTVDWGKCNYINPPYKTAKLWVKKAYEESLKGKTCVLLLASRTGTRWFHDYVLPFAKEIRFIKGRLKFSDAKNLAPFDSIIVVFKQ